MSYIIQNEDGEIQDEAETIEEIAEELRKIRADMVAYNREDYERYPQFYAEPFDPEEGLDEYMRDVYTIYLEVPFPEL